jgi:rsbT antagonist protein RsbS
MAIPILRLNDRVLIVALGAELMDETVIEFKADLAERCTRFQTRGVVIDVSALDLVDTYMARMLNETARMLRLLGADVVVCGIRPSVAMTFVEMGSRLLDVATTFNLERGLTRLADLMADADTRDKDVAVERSGHHA